MRPLRQIVPLGEAWKARKGSIDFDHRITNTTRVGGTGVDIEFTAYTPAEGTYSVEFGTEDYPKSSKAGGRVLTHVLRKTDQFIRRIRPSRLEFTAYEPRLDDLYKKAAPYLADKHAGHVVRDMDGNFAIEFPLNKKGIGKYR